jgi:hypothetical protein
MCRASRQLVEGPYWDWSRESVTPQAMYWSAHLVVAEAYSSQRREGW